MNPKITLKDVAREAKVSAATVSYVINQVGNQTIPQETRDRIYAAVKKLNYVQNLTARSLSKGVTQLLGVLFVSNELDLIPKSISYGKYMNEFERLAARHGYHLVVTHINPNDPQLDIIQERKLDGVLIMDACEQSFHTVSRQFRFGTPVVLVDSYIGDPLFRSLNCDWTQLFTSIRSTLHDTPFVIIHEHYHNRHLQDALHRASKLSASKICVVNNMNDIHTFIHNHPEHQIVVFNEFLSLHTARYCDPSIMIVVCTAECSEFVPEGARKLVLTDSKAKRSFELILTLIQQPYSNQMHDQLISFS